MSLCKFGVAAALISIFLLSGAVSTAGHADELPLMVGGTAHGAKFIDALADLGLGNFVWIPKQGYSPAPWDAQHDILADVEACKRRNLYFIISQRRGLGASFKPGGYEYGGDTTPEIHSNSRVKQIADLAGNLLAGLHAEELDADLLQTGLRPGFRTRIPEVYSFTDRAGGRKCFEGELGRIAKIYHDYAPGVKFWPNMCVSFQHSGFRAGGDVVIAELLEGLPATELQLAYLRGGGRQFSKDWGIWVSPWYWGTVPCEDTELWKEPYAKVGGGHSPSAFRRCLYLSYGSGARALTVQETACLISGKDGGGYKLAAWGKELKNFWDYASNHREHMDPVVPLALMVDKDNGWAPGHLDGDWMKHETIWGKLPVERADLMLPAYLDVLLPGFERDTPGWWKEKGVTYPGYFASTPIGAFDIVSSDISQEKLSTYPAIMLMADINMTADLLKVLRAYVKNGGSLYVNASQMRCGEHFVNDPEFLGCTIGMTHRWAKWSHSDLKMTQVYPSSKIVSKIPLTGVGEQEFAEPWYMAQDVQPTTAEIAADDGAGHPVLLRNRYGEGWVYLSTPEYMMQGFDDFNKPLSFFRSIILGLAQSGPVGVTAPHSQSAQTDISWVASYQGTDSAIIVLANHGLVKRQVEVAWRKPCHSGTVEVGKKSTEPRKDGNSTIFSLQVAPEDVSVLRIEGIHR